MKKRKQVKGSGKKKSIPKARCRMSHCKEVLTKRELAEYGGVCVVCYYDSSVQH